MDYTCSGHNGHGEKEDEITDESKDHLAPVMSKEMVNFRIRRLYRSDAYLVQLGHFSHRASRHFEN